MRRCYVVVRSGSQLDVLAITPRTNVQTELFVDGVTSPARFVRRRPADASYHTSSSTLMTWQRAGHVTARCPSVRPSAGSLHYSAAQDGRREVDGRDADRRSPTAARHGTARHGAPASSLNVYSDIAVSYTHLTLPTILRV